MRRSIGIMWLIGVLALAGQAQDKPNPSKDALARLRQLGCDVQTDLPQGGWRIGFARCRDLDAALLSVQGVTAVHALDL